VTSRWLSLRLRLHALQYGTRLQLAPNASISFPLRFGLNKTDVSIGKGSCLAEHGVLSAGGGRIVIGNHVRMDRFWSCKLIRCDEEGFIHIGDQCHFEEQVRLIVFDKGKVSIGRGGIPRLGKYFGSA